MSAMVSESAKIELSSTIDRAQLVLDAAVRWQQARNEHDAAQRAWWATKKDDEASWREYMLTKEAMEGFQAQLALETQRYMERQLEL